MAKVKLRFLELCTELIVFFVAMLSTLIFNSDKESEIQYSQLPWELFEFLYFAAGLWLAVCIFRLIYMQIPLAWTLTHYMIAGEGLKASMQTGLVNFASFVVVILLASLHSEIVAGFLNGEMQPMLPALALVATSLSPIVLHMIKVKWGETEIGRRIF